MTLGSLHHGFEEWEQPDPGDGESVLSDAVDALALGFGPRLAAVYALGSLAHGGFRPLVSDVDVAALLTDPVQPTDGERILEAAAAVRAGGSPLHGRLSVFWASPEILSGKEDGGRFPPLDRLCLLEHGRLLRGTDVRSGLPFPDTAELTVAGAAFALDLLGGETTKELATPDVLVARGLRWVTKVVLFPARLLFTAETGREGTNPDAAALYEQQGWPGARLVTAALAWRAAVPDPASVTDLLEAELASVYRHFVDDYAGRLTGLGEPDLAAAFRDWASRLVRSCAS